MRRYYLLYLIVVSIIFFILDLLIGTIIIYPTAGTRNSYFHHNLKKNFRGIKKWGNTSYAIYTNSLGFIDEKNRIINSKKDKYRIMFIGDSFVEGTGTPYPNTFVGIIDKQLRKKNIESVNAGVGGYCPKLYYLKVKYLVEKLGLQIDELNVFIDISDIHDEILYRDFIPKEGLLVSIVINLGNFFKQHSLSCNIYSKYLKSKICSLLNSRRGNSAEVELWTLDEDIYKKWEYEGIAIAEKNMDKLYQLCKMHRIKMIIAVYPHPKQIELRDLNSKQVIFWHDFCDKRNIKFINYYPDFINNPHPKEVINKYFIKGDIHWNENGHHLIAQKWLNFYDKPPNSRN